MSGLARLVGLAGRELDGVRSSPDDDRRRAEVIAAAFLGFVTEPGDGTLGRVVDALGDAVTADLLLAPVGPADLARRVNERGGALDEREAETALGRWRPRADHGAFVRSLAQAARVEATLIAPGDHSWPAAVDDLGTHAPRCLWVRGSAQTVAASRSIALVGARAATSYGERVAIESAAGLVDRGFVVVSGGAYGIDGMAHRSALASGGPTVAFLAGGVDRFYPLGHESLLTRITEQGAVVSEVPCGTAPTKWRFLQRNRLIAAASAATVVLEAGMRSGSLNTAGHAAALARPLGAVPGPVTSAASAGCHRLLREYDAVCVTDAAEMAELADDGMHVPAVPTTSAPSRAEAPDRRQVGSGDPVTAFAQQGDGRRILDALSTRTARTIDEVATRSGLDVGALMAGLGRLEAGGAVARRGGGWLASARVRG